MSRMRRRGAGAIGMALIVGSSFAGDGQSPAYHWRGGAISPTGSVRVSGKARALASIDYRTQLSAEELGALAALVRSTQFFSQPERLAPHLMAYARTHESRQKVMWALEALAWITTPEEFCGFVALGLENEAQRATLLSIAGTHPFYGNIPDSHVQALCPVYLAPLAAMGRAGLAVLTPCLDDPDAAHRTNTIELLTCISRTGPHGGFANPLSEHAYRQLIPTFERSILPRLAHLTKDDSSAGVRRKAAKAAEEIALWIAKAKPQDKHEER